MLRLAFDGRLSNLWTAMPGIVKAVDFSTMTLSVQPAIQGEVTDENGQVTFVNLPLLIFVPIVFPSAGGFTLTLPIQINDEVLVVWASRCIDAWWQSGGIQKAMESRMHDLSDGFALPGIHSKPNVISGISTTAAQLRNNAGNAYVEISSDGKVKLVSATEIDLNGPVKITGETDITGAVNITGDVAVTGKIGAIGDIKAGTVSLEHHVHSGVTPGLGDSGPPVP